MQETYSLRNVAYRQILFIPELDIPSASFFWVTGPSGGGKTTFLKLLNNLVSCDRGEIFYYGHNLLALDPVDLRRRAVMVSQTPYIFPLSVRDNIQLVFHFNRKEAVSQETMENLLAHFGLPGMLDQSTHNLSGGEKQRLALARALLLDPETLLLDEPTAALDEENSLIVFNYLSDWVKKNNRTIVMVSHAATHAGEYADQIMTLQRGKMIGLEGRMAADERITGD